MFLKLGIFLVVVVALSVGGMVHMTQVAGPRTEGELPPLSFEEQSMRERLGAHLDEITIRIGVRNVSRHDAVERTVNYIVASITGMGYQPRREEFDVDGKTMTNVVVEITGAATSREIVLLGAHYDSYMRSPCANASATGTAALLEVLRALRGETLARTVRVVFFATGERPWARTKDMGSRVYAKQCAERHDDIVMAIAVQSVGHFYDSDGSQNFPFPLNMCYPSTADFVGVFGPLSSRSLVEKVAAAWVSGSKIPLVAGSLPGWFPGTVASHHESFASEGFPAVLITDTGRYRYSDIRTKFDSMARIDYDRMARVVSGIKGVVMRLARAGA